MVLVVMVIGRDAGCWGTDKSMIRPSGEASGGLRLPEGEVDAVLPVDAYHEFSHPKEMGEGIARASAPGGRLDLVEYRGEMAEIPIKPLHKMTTVQARRDFEAVGLRWVEVRGFFPDQHLMVFEKPGD